MPEIIVGVDECERTKDAMALATRLAGPAGAELVLGCAYPYDNHPSRALSSEYRRYLKEEAEGRLAEARAEAGDVAVTTYAIADVSPSSRRRSSATR